MFLSKADGRVRSYTAPQSRRLNVQESVHAIRMRRGYVGIASIQYARGHCQDDPCATSFTTWRILYASARVRNRAVEVRGCAWVRAPRMARHASRNVHMHRCLIRALERSLVPPCVALRAGGRARGRQPRMRVATPPRREGYSGLAVKSNLKRVTPSGLLRQC